jgi:hypothetical protein
MVVILNAMMGSFSALDFIGNVLKYTIPVTLGATSLLLGLTFVFAVIGQVRKLALLLISMDAFLSKLTWLTTVMIERPFTETSALQLIFPKTLINS